MSTSDKLRAVWNNNKVPVILRRTGPGQKLRVRLPYGKHNKQWLGDGHRSAAEWNRGRKCWELPKIWFDDFVKRALARYGELYVVQPYHEQEKCSPACMNARGHECQCSCMGANHGQGNDGSWFEVSETFATRWGELELACRLMRDTSR